MKRPSAILLCFFVLSSLTACGEAVLHGPPNPPPIPDSLVAMEQEITVMSFNVWTRRESLDERLDGVVHTILSEAPDSFGLQEAHEGWKSAMERALGGLYGAACDTGRDHGSGEAVPVYYLLEKYELVDEGVFWLSDKPGAVTKGWDASLRRVAGYAVLRDKATGFTYAHFNSHFDHIGPIARANSARLVADRINAMGLPAVFTADVNAGPDELPPQYLEAGGLRDLRKTAAVTDTGGTFHGYSGGERVIDYIYANHYMSGAAYFNVIRDEYDGMYPSDHFAVSAKLMLAN